MFTKILINILLFYAILIVINIPAPFLGLNFENDSNKTAWYALPDFLIPLVWFVLFTLLGIARYFVVESAEAYYSKLLIGLGILCAAYAYYTLGLESLTGISALWFGLAGNIAVILYTAFVVWSLYRVVPAAAFLTVPVVIWTSFATLIVLAELKDAKLL
ncbi:MAG TPA: tryptophan-rich sensory protein [Pyrinomonadaceae bacterium]|nr:tryptophan-rich sensory protein [Pyrinomonadaceae bacterium]